MRRFLLIIVLSGLTLAGFAQNEWKYSPSTQMFLSELLGETELPQSNRKVEPSITFTAPISISKEEQEKFNKLNYRRIAEAEMVDGVKMISAFIAFTDNDYSALEPLGVVIQSEFKELVAALIPVTKIEEVAALNNVKLIEVAEVLKPTNDLQRTVTKAYDAITNSAAAQQLGIDKSYTGKGVILGIIDGGIDFQHIAFKDKNGKTRIKRAYIQSGSSLTTYSSESQINGLTYDTNAGLSGDHGTHTSSTAGGSSVIVEGNNVTVTDDHANATYGGMAPEADLVIAGLPTLYNTTVATAIQNICNYADSQNQPCVISMSFGSQQGPHDGTGSMASVINQYAGNNHILVYAASNEAMTADRFIQFGTTTGGGMYASGTSTPSKTMLANLQKAWRDADGNVQLYKSTIHAYARTANTDISMKFRVVDTTTGDVVYSSNNAYNNSTTINMTGNTGLSKYFYTTSSQANPYGDTGIIRIIKGIDSYSGKYYFTIHTPLLNSRSYDDEDGDGVDTSKYALCISVYPTNGSTIIDMWEDYGVDWFGNDLTLSSTYANSYNVVKGNDDCSVSTNACYNNVISVGAYVTKNKITDYAGTTHNYSTTYPNIGDHAYYSSWQAEGSGPLGTALPTINAPGARIVAGVNHYHTADVDDYSYWNENNIGDLVVNNTDYPYAAMEGTSMATPCVSGIIAQWLEACVEKGITANPDYIKEVMAATWDTDEWTNGTAPGAHGAKTFGTHGKINAIKGLQYILGVQGGPSFTTDPEKVAFVKVTNEEYVINREYTKTLTVTGTNLEGNITATLTGDNVFTISPTTIAQDPGTGTITITYKPTAVRNADNPYTATLTLTTTNIAAPTIINITGTSVQPEIITDPEELEFEEIMAGETDTKTFDVLAANLNDVVNVTVTEGSDVFSVDPSSISIADAEEGATITVTFTPTTPGTYTGTVTLSSTDAESCTVALSATATKWYPDTFKVTISTYGLSTLYLDYPVVIPYDDYEDDLLGVFYAYKYVKESKELKLARIKKHIPAYTGVIVMGNSGTYNFPRLKTGEPDALNYTNLLSGNIEAMTAEEAKTKDGKTGDLLTLGKGSNGYVGFYRWDGNDKPSKKLNPNKAYFIIPEDAQNAQFVSLGGFGGDFTGISEVGLNIGEGAWYTLQGLRLEGQPRQSGIYIHNGKAVVVK